VKLRDGTRHCNRGQKAAIMPLAEEAGKAQPENDPKVRDLPE